MQLDELHKAILNELQQNARISNAELGRRIGLTAPAVGERIKRLEEAGIIKGFGTHINFRRLQYTEKALIGVKLPHAYTDTFLKATEKIAGITDIVRVTGEYCFFVSVTVSTRAELDVILDQFGAYGETITYGVLSEPVEGKAIML